MTQTTTQWTPLVPRLTLHQIQERIRQSHAPKTVVLESLDDLGAVVRSACPGITPRSRANRSATRARTTCSVYVRMRAVRGHAYDIIRVSDHDGEPNGDVVLDIRPAGWLTIHEVVQALLRT